MLLSFPGRPSNPLTVECATMQIPWTFCLEGLDTTMSRKDSTRFRSNVNIKKYYYTEHSGTIPSTVVIYRAQWYYTERSGIIPSTVVYTWLVYARINTFRSLCTSPLILTKIPKRSLHFRTK